ncbi:MAG: hypothetical protein ACXW3C_07820, partial [Pyrinomonadaceae bacterium]
MSRLLLCALLLSMFALGTVRSQTPATGESKRATPEVSGRTGTLPNNPVEDCACESQVLPDALAIVNGVRITRRDIERATEKSVNQLQRQVIEARKRELDLQINSRLLA